VVQLAFPVDAWGDNVPMMLLAIAATVLPTVRRCGSWTLPCRKNFLKFFKGPKFGVRGNPEGCLVFPKRPLSLHILKPKMGMTPEQVANQCYQTQSAELNLIKDDEMTSDVSNNNYLDRLKAVRKALARAEAKTGKKVIYLLSITHEPGQIMERRTKRLPPEPTGSW